jgi:hypothetical protein
MKNTLNDSTLTLHVKKNSLVAGAQVVITIKLGQSFDVTPQAVSQPVNLPQDLFSHAGRQPFQVGQGGRGVCIKFRQFLSLKFVTLPEGQSE